MGKLPLQWQGFRISASTWSVLPVTLMYFRGSEQTYFKRESYSKRFPELRVLFTFGEFPGSGQNTQVQHMSARVKDIPFSRPCDILRSIQLKKFSNLCPHEGPSHHYTDTMFCCWDVSDFLPIWNSSLFQQGCLSGCHSTSDGIPILPVDPCTLCSICSCSLGFPWLAPMFLTSWSCIDGHDMPILPFWCILSSLGSYDKRLKYTWEFIKIIQGPSLVSPLVTTQHQITYFWSLKIKRSIFNFTFSQVGDW